MTAFVLMPGDVHHLEPLSPTKTTTVVLCGDIDRIQRTVPASVYSDAHVKIMASAAELREYADRHSPPDTCIIVTPLSDGPTVPLARLLRARGWSRVSVLSPKADARAVFGALTAGVHAVVVNRECEPAGTAKHRPLDGPKLSSREIEVLRMVADGMTNRCIGAEMGLSALTVKSHLARIARKLGCGDRAQMVAEAIRSGYIE